MKRRAALALVALAVASPATLRAQRARRPRIGYAILNPLTDPPSRERAAFLQGLREFGYEPGKTVEIVYASAEGEPAFMDGVIKEILGKGIDVLAVSGAVSTLSAKYAGGPVPVVMLAVGDPVGIGAVSSLARPDGRLTGVSFISSDLAPKRVEMLRIVVPNVKRVAVTWDERNANASNEFAAVRDTARRFGIEVDSYPASSDATLARALESIRSRRPDAMYVVFEGTLSANNRTTLAEFGLSERLPVISGWSFLTEAGGLLSYAPNISTMFHRAAYYVHRLLQGAKPGDLPIEQPTQIDLVLNLKTARALGLQVPRELLLRADRVIE